jgi:hypothetical protein
LEIEIKASASLGERTVRPFWNRTHTSETQTEFWNGTKTIATQTDVVIDLTLDEPWTIEPLVNLVSIPGIESGPPEPLVNQPKIWDQEQITKNLIAIAEHDILDILSNKGESDINLNESLVDQIQDALAKLALQSQSVITKYNF